MSDALGQDQFQPVNRRAGYGDALEMALSAARKGWTLSAGQGLLIIEHYEEKLAATIGERESFMHRMYEARDDADRAERQFNIVTDMLVEQASLLTHYEEKLDRIEALTRERDEARERLAQWVSWGDRMASGHPDAPMASLDHEVRAVIANRYGMSVITRNTQKDA